MYIDTIIAKRDGKELTKEQIDEFVKGIVSLDVPDVHIAAFTMAVYFQKLNHIETAHLTNAMAYTGKTVAWDENDLGGPVLEKHSSGGIGDKVSILLAPMIAACGGFIPMVSGRGLGHTGGTLDKLDAIPNYSIQPKLTTLENTIKQVGCAIVGSSEDIAPGDRRMYGIRDITATTEPIELITASILSKKVALGAKRLIMDIKIGSGAFMQTKELGLELASAMNNVAKEIGLDFISYLTDMNTPLGNNAGNALEITEVCAILTKEIEGESRLLELTLTLVAEMLIKGNLVNDFNEGYAKAKQSINDGSAAEKLNQMVAYLGGPNNFIENYQEHLPFAKFKMDLFANEEGYVESIDVTKLGYSVVDLGAGRRNLDDKLDYSVGLENMAGVGDQVGSNANGKAIATIHAKSKADANKAAQEILDAYKITSEKTNHLDVIVEKIV